MTLNDGTGMAQYVPGMKQDGEPPFVALV